MLLVLQECIIIVEFFSDCCISSVTVTGYRRTFLPSLGCLQRPNMPDMMVCLLQIKHWCKACHAAGAVNRGDVYRFFVNHSGSCWGMGRLETALRITAEQKFPNRRWAAMNSFPLAFVVGVTSLYVWNVAIWWPSTVHPCCSSTSASPQKHSIEKSLRLSFRFCW